MIGLNSHTAAKPYIYQDVARYYDLKQVNLQTYKEGTSWWSKKYLMSTWCKFKVTIIGLLLIQFLIYKQERITLQIFPQPSTTQEGLHSRGLG